MVKSRHAGDPVGVINEGGEKFLPEAARRSARPPFQRSCSWGWQSEDGMSVVLAVSGVCSVGVVSGLYVVSVSGL